MLDNEIKKYFDGIEPDNELVERMVAMSKNTENPKRIKMSKKIVAIIAAIVCAIGATTATAAIVRMANDKNGIVSIQESDDSFTLDFTKAQRRAEKLSDTDNNIVKVLNDKGFKDVVIPAELLNGKYEIVNTLGFIPQYTSGMFDFSDGSNNSISMSIIQDIPDEEAVGFWGTGDENSTGEVVTVNGMDIIIAYMGEPEIGYSSFIFYANGNTIYQISYHCGNDMESLKEGTMEFVNTLAQ